MRRGAAELRRQGYRLIGGVDEAGTGPLAGPLIAAAVILPPGVRLPGVDDSKKLRPEARESWAQQIREKAVAHAFGEVSVEEIERVGPYEGSIRAMMRAVSGLAPQPDYLLSDARRLPLESIPHRAVIHGDRRHLVIAAASILAKVHRDRLMVEMEQVFPGYGFARHKGYGTREHLGALDRLGVCPAHRKNYGPVKSRLPP